MCLTALWALWRNYRIKNRQSSSPSYHGSIFQRLRSRHERRLLVLAASAALADSAWRSLQGWAKVGSWEDDGQPDQQGGDDQGGQVAMVVTWLLPTINVWVAYALNSYLVVYMLRCLLFRARRGESAWLMRWWTVSNVFLWVGCLSIIVALGVDESSRQAGADIISVQRVLLYFKLGQARSISYSHRIPSDREHTFKQA